jgi:hypothetical protein
MRFFERFSILDQSLSSQKPIKKILISTGAATLTMTVVLWGNVLWQENTSLFKAQLASESPAMNEPTMKVIPRGLSRQRRDFDRALNILEDAASDDNRLTDYFARVQKRVTGESMTPEKISAVQVVNHRDKVNQPAITEKPGVGLAGATALKPAGHHLVWAKLKGFFSKTPTKGSQTAQSEPLSRDDLPVRVDHEPTPRADRLTIGDLRFDSNPAIDRWVKYYTANQGGRQTMQIGINRSSSYLDLARAEFRHLEVPQDLVWLAHVESVWHSKATSPAAAGGLWQFIPSTALDYGLNVSLENDERLDPAKQTRVAATYLHDLYTLFGDWSLAMAAYNCGEPRVMGAIVKNGRADFWEIHQKQLLPKETLNYVPKILAAIEVASQAESYGFWPDSLAESAQVNRDSDINNLTP